jgi:hypothetical protein
MSNAIETKRDLLASELQRYFGEICATLAARWGAAIVSLASPALRELAGRLQALVSATDETNHQLRAAQAAAFEDHQSAEVLLDRAIASVEHLSEIAQAIMERLDKPF